MSFARALGSRALRLGSSFGLACTLLILLGLLTWLGTLEQVHTGLYEVQKKYFESYVVLHDLGWISIPLPGANLVLCVLALNLLLGGIVRLRLGWRNAGVLVAHLGIVILLAAAFIKNHHSDEGHVTLYEGESATYFQSYYRWELVVSEPLGDARVREHLFAHELLQSAEHEPVRLASKDLPFELEIASFMANCRPQKSVSAADGVALREEPRDPQAEANIAGAHVTLADTRNAMRLEALVWGAEARPWSVLVAGKRWEVNLRKERYPLPFTLALEHFTKEDHPRSSMPKSFASDVKVRENGAERDAKISMNEPLREQGLVLYQASWGPSNAGPKERLFSTFAVVRNPADVMPLVACIVIAAGMLFHFARKLTRYMKSEVRAA